MPPIPPPDAARQHSLLRRQLRRFFTSENPPNAEFDAFVQAVNNAYHEADDDRAMLERSLELSSNELLQANTSLRAEKELLAVTLQSIGEGVIATDTDGKITLINPIAETLTSTRQAAAIGQSIEAVFTAVETAKGIPLTFEHLIRRASSAKAWRARLGDSHVAYRAAPIHDEGGTLRGFVLTFRDIEQERRLETERVRASRLESIGLLAGGIAHDFNNILMILVGNLSIAESYIAMPGPAGEEKIRKLLGEALCAGLRARDLTQQLLTFSKGGAPIKNTASIAQVIDEAVGFALHGSNVRCVLSLAPDLLPVDIDLGQMSQVFNNLIINAKQAMPNGGDLIIEAYNLDRPAAEARASGKPLADAHHFVAINVRDQGTGISEEHLDLIFDPYFTTKQSGSGLGLATSYSVVQNHQGLLSAESEEGVGTTFHILLPASSQAVSEEPPEPLTEGSAVNARVLIMDDEPSILSLVAEMLEQLGYQMDAAQDGQEATQKFRQAFEAGSPYDVVILDLTIPGSAGGREAAANLLKIDPGTQLIASSGYSNDPVMSRFQDHGFAAVLPKPYRLGDLRQLLQKVLSST